MRPRVAGGERVQLAEVGVLARMVARLFVARCCDELPRRVGESAEQLVVAKEEVLGLRRGFLCSSGEQIRVFARDTDIQDRLVLSAAVG